MQKYSAVVLSNGSSLTGAQGTAPKTYNGGQGVLVIEAGNFGADIHLQVNHSSSWINLQSSTIDFSQVIPYSLPAGEYRLFSQSSVVSEIFATIAPTT